MIERRTQAERREATQANLLTAARTLFGSKGYAETSIEEIAAACDLTVRPIYHYFKSKLGLFKAVIEQIERESIDRIHSHKNPDLNTIWSGFMTRCEDPHFRQIILVDGPALLGHKQMANGAISHAARQGTAEVLGARTDGLTMSLLFGALSNAALYIAEHGASEGDYAKIRDLIEFHSE